MSTRGWTWMRRGGRGGGAPHPAPRLTAKRGQVGTSRNCVLNFRYFGRWPSGSEIGCVVPFGGGYSPAGHRLVDTTGRDFVVVGVNSAPISPEDEGTNSPDRRRLDHSSRCGTDFFPLRLLAILSWSSIGPRGASPAREGPIKLGHKLVGNLKWVNSDGLRAIAAVADHVGHRWITSDSPVVRVRKQAASGRYAR